MTGSKTLHWPVQNFLRSLLMSRILPPSFPVSFPVSFHRYPSFLSCFLSQVSNQYCSLKSLQPSLAPSLHSPINPCTSKPIRAYSSWGTQTNTPAHRKSTTNVSYYHDCYHQIHYFCHYLVLNPSTV